MLFGLREKHKVQILIEERHMRRTIVWGSIVVLLVALTNENSSVARYLIFGDGDDCIHWAALNEASS